MNCRKARRLLNEGVVPSSYEVQQTLLGFHLATCADCRTYRTKLAYRQYSDLLLLAALLSQPASLPAQQVASSSKRAARRNGRRVARLASAALAIGALFAMSPAAQAAAPAAARAAAPAAIQPQNDVLAIDRQQYSRPAHTAFGSEQTLLMTVTQAAPVSAPPQQASVHVVAFGESLWSIAQRYYRDGAQWRTIYDANAGVIGANWNLIYPGTRLTIPQVVPPVEPKPGTGEVEGMYTVRSGDTLSSIAQLAYGNAGLWSAIYAANQATISNPHWIYPGQVLLIPRIGSITQPPQSGVGGLYTVQRGDTLWSIAQRAYGDGTRWSVIYQANRNKISDPNLIFAGTELSLPR